MASNFISLYKLTSNESDAAKFLQQCGIIHRERFCECGSVMKGIMKTSHGSQIPGWRCTTRACDKYKGVRPNTWLDPSKTPLDTVVHFIYWWAREQTSIIFCERVRHEPQYYRRLVTIYEGSLCLSYASKRK